MRVPPGKARAIKDRLAPEFAPAADPGAIDMAKKKVHASRKAAGKSIKKKRVKSPVKTRKTGRSATVGPSPARLALDNLVWTHATTDKLIDATPSEHALHQAGGADNHLLWTIGHLAVTYSWFATLLDGKAAELPKNYYELFGYGSKPVGDSGIYPPLTEVRKNYAVAYRRFLGAADGLAPADFDKPTVADSHGFAKNRLEVILRAAWHDGWHSGQLSAIRRSLNLPSIM